MRLVPLKNTMDVADWCAHHIVDAINAFSPTASRPFVLGLPAGNSPLNTFQRLIELHRTGDVSFANVVTFNMDEYVGLGPSDPQSYAHFMHHHLFHHLDLQPQNINVLDGMAEDLETECVRYEAKIKCYDTINLFLGGVGTDGHLAFNEPASSLHSRTRVKALTATTRINNARFFDDDVEQVPKLALTIGLATLLDANEVVVLATGNSKAYAVKAAVEGAISQLWPISVLQQHPKATIICDPPATMELQVKTLTYFQDATRNKHSKV